MVGTVLYDCCIGTRLAPRLPGAYTSFSPMANLASVHIAVLSSLATPCLPSPPDGAVTSQAAAALRYRRRR